MPLTQDSPAGLALLATLNSLAAQIHPEALATDESRNLVVYLWLLGERVEYVGQGEASSGRPFDFYTDANHTTAVRRGENYMQRHAHELSCVWAASGLPKSAALDFETLLIERLNPRLNVGPGRRYVGGSARRGSITAPMPARFQPILPGVLPASRNQRAGRYHFADRYLPLSAVITTKNPERGLHRTPERTKIFDLYEVGRTIDDFVLAGLASGLPKTRSQVSMMKHALWDWSGGAIEVYATAAAWASAPPRRPGP